MKINKTKRNAFLLVGWYSFRISINFSTGNSGWYQVMAQTCADQSEKISRSSVSLHGDRRANNRPAILEGRIMLFLAFERKECLYDSLNSFASLFIHVWRTKHTGHQCSYFFFSFLSYIPYSSTFFLKTLSVSGLLGVLVVHSSLLAFRSSVKRLEMVSNLGRKFSRKDI